MALNWVDWVIVGIIGLSTVLSLYRGFVREALSLASWVAATAVTFLLRDQMDAQLAGVIENDTLRYVSACVILFAATLMLGSLLSRLLFQLVRMTGLSGLDRVLGTAFGFSRGMIVVLVMLFIARQLLPADAQDDLNASLLMPHLDMILDWAESNVETLADNGEIPWPQQ